MTKEFDWMLLSSLIWNGLTLGIMWVPTTRCLMEGTDDEWNFPSLKGQD